MFLADQDKFKTFYRDVRAYLKSTQYTCLKEGYEGDPKICVHSGYHECPDSVLFAASIISAISADWTGEERGRYWKSCCTISIVANAKYYGGTQMRRWRRYWRESEKAKSDIHK